MGFVFFTTQYRENSQKKEIITVNVNWCLRLGKSQSNAKQKLIQM